MSELLSLSCWQTDYQAAIVELDHDQLPIRIDCARRSIEERLRQLDLHRADEREERDRALGALHMLAILETTTMVA